MYNLQLIDSLYYWRVPHKFLFLNSIFFFLHYVECPSGAFKSTISNTKCVHCPLKSVSNAERTACTCEEGFYRLRDIEDCKGTVQSYSI